MADTFVARNIRMQVMYEDEWVDLGVVNEFEVEFNHDIQTHFSIMGDMQTFSTGRTTSKAKGTLSPEAAEKLIRMIRV